MNWDGWIPIWHSLQIITRNCAQNEIPNILGSGISGPDVTGNYQLVLVTDCIEFTLSSNIKVIPLICWLAGTVYSSDCAEFSTIHLSIWAENIIYIVCYSSLPGIDAKAERKYIVSVLFALVSIGFIPMESIVPNGSMIPSESSWISLEIFDTKNQYSVFTVFVHN